MASLKKLIVFMVSIVTFFYTFYVVGLLMAFLSRPKDVPKAYTWIINLLDNRSRLTTSYSPIVFDTLYLIGFIFQHSFMKSAIVKQILKKLRLEVAERTIYNMTTSLCLHYLINNWQSAPTIILWQVDVKSSSALWWCFILTQGFAWTVIYGGCLIMDFSEMLGTKQAYYDLKNLPPPQNYKSEELKNLYEHVRHPSFIGFTIILWVINLMTLDRFIMSLLLTIYMYCAWSTNKNDVKYQQLQLQRKIRSLLMHN